VAKRIDPARVPVDIEGDAAVATAVITSLPALAVL
jgi:hypothetical protein